jgi:hypothetical protein
MSEQPVDKLSEAIGGCANYQEFLYKQRVYWLRWRRAGDSEESRLVRRILAHPLHEQDPIDVAALCDTVAWVEQNCDQVNEADLYSCLLRTCLFGSKRVAVFLMAKLNLGGYSEELYGDICLSRNVEWAKEVFGIFRHPPADFYFECLEYEQIDPRIMMLFIPQVWCDT